MCVREREREWERVEGRREEGREEERAQERVTKHSLHAKRDINMVLVKT